MDAARLLVVAVLAALLAVPAPALARHKHKRHRHASPPPALAAPNPPAAIGACPDAALAPAPDDLDRVQAATLCLVNQERARVGLGALDDQPQLDRAAAEHAADMLARDFFDHVTLDGLTPLDRISADGYHRANILRPEFRDSGIAVAASVPASDRDGLPGGLYVQEFGVRSP
jgi:uncharacterized protein YkwD